MSNPLISVIVPCYNVEKYVDECLDSIIRQTYKNLEIIVVNDASTDSTVDGIKRYVAKDERIKFIDLRQNGGLSAARNAGIEVATGEYISFIDSDDILDKRFYDTLVRIMFMDPEVDIAVSVVKTFTAMPCMSNTILEEKDFSVWMPADKFELIKKDSVTFVLQTNKLYRRELFKGLRYPEGHIHEDAYLIYDEYSKARKITYTNDTCYYYRVGRKGSITNSVNRKRIDDTVFAYEHMCQSALENGDTNFYKYARKKELADFMYMYIACNDKPEDTFKFVKSIFNANQNIFSWGERKKFKLFFMSPKIMAWLLNLKGGAKKKANNVSSYFGF